MNVVVVTCVFRPEPVVSAETSAGLASELAKRGHNVFVICPYPSKPSGVLFRGFKRSLLRTERTSDGVAVTRFYTLFSRKSRFFSRFLENVSFGIASAVAILACRRQIDVIYANTWPIFAQVLLLLAAKVRHAPVVLSLQDVYPESISSQRRISEQHILFGALLRLDRIIAKHAAHYIVISPRFKELLVNKRGVRDSVIDVIFNWGPILKPAGCDALNVFRKNIGVPTAAKLCVYAGNVGPAAGVVMLVHAFGHLRSRTDIYLIIAGEGSELGRVTDLVRTLRLANVRFHAPYTLADNPLVLGAADLLLLPTQGDQAKYSVPSKLINYLMSERPILARCTMDSDMADLIRTAGAGWCIESDKSEEIAASIERTVDMPRGMLADAGRNGRRFAISHMSDLANLPRMAEVVVGSARRQSAASARTVVGDAL